MQGRPSANSPFSAEATGLRRARRPPLPPGPYLVVGLGRPGFAAARALAAKVEPGAVLVWDGAANPPQRRRAAELRAAGVEVSLGGDGLDALDGRRTVVKSPGVRADVPLIVKAVRRGVTVVDELELGWHLVPAPTVAITGSNGKSTTSGLCLQLLAAHGSEPVLTGNTEFGPPFSEIAMAAVPRAVVAEVSSFQAELARELAVDAAVFTNLTPDHLNRHGGIEPYRAAKRRLFVRGEWCVPFASLNGDDEFGCRLAAEIRERGGEARTFGFGAGADYRIAECDFGLTGAELALEAPDGRVEMQTRLPGRHNAANVAAALAFADWVGIDCATAVATLSTADPVPGRFELVEVDAPFDVIVDFGYTPGSVVAALGTARDLAHGRGGRLLVVFALLGRAAVAIGREVGECARELSDHLVLSASPPTAAEGFAHSTIAGSCGKYATGNGSVKPITIAGSVSSSFIVNQFDPR